MSFGTTGSCLDSDRLHCDKNWIHMPSASGSCGRMAGEIGMSYKIFKNSLQCKLFRFLLHLRAVQCYYSVSIAFQSAFLSEAYLNYKACFKE